jgi:hypothetical protein
MNETLPLRRSFTRFASIFVQLSAADASLPQARYMAPPAADSLDLKAQVLKR